MGARTQQSLTAAARQVAADTNRGLIVGDDAEPPQRTITPAEQLCDTARQPRKARGTRTASDAFRKQWYPAVSAAEWNNWRWQLQNRLSSFDQLNRIFQLSPQETAALRHPTMPLPVAVTPYYASLADPFDSTQAIRRCIIPVDSECRKSKGESEDPLGEAEQSPVPGLVHRYPDRVLFLSTSYCSTYCRYCTRSRLVGHGADCGGAVRDRWQMAIDYIASHPQVRDVLISGGDPLTLPDDALGWLLGELRAIPHVEIIRIGTKVPAVLPQRITPALCTILRRAHPVWISIHATHPDEVTPEMKAACERLADSGMPLGSQTVLLAGINDSADVLKDLYHKLMMARVRPYYLYQCDPIVGSAHFRTSVSRGVDIIRKLRGFTTGYSVPTYVIDAPGGGGKIPISPDYVVSNGDGTVLLRNYEGKVFAYPDIIRD
jgi:lysine 2,3-aminomutase